MKLIVWAPTGVARSSSSPSPFTPESGLIGSGMTGVSGVSGVVLAGPFETVMVNVEPGVIADPVPGFEPMNPPLAIVS